MMTDYEEGREAAEQYFNSRCYAQFTRDITGEHAIKFFKPPVNESLMMVYSPMPKDRAEWMKGFDDWKAENIKGEEHE